MNRYRFLSVWALIAMAMLAAPSDLDAAITIVSGNGQMNVPPPLIPQYFPFFNPLIVKVTDANGVPQANATVTWNITSGSFGATLQFGSTTTTDFNGLASNSVVYPTGAAQSSAGQPFSQATIVASTFDASVTFFQTLGLAGPPIGQTGFLSPISWTAGQYLSELLAGTPFSGQSGTTGPTPITLRVRTSSGFPVPNVSMQIVSIPQDPPGPTVQCAENQGGEHMALTNELGIATCTPLFGGAPGTGQYYIQLGQGGVPPIDPLVPSIQTLTVRTMNVTVTPASAAVIRITQGNNQTVNPSQSLPLALQVEVDGANGVPLIGQQVQWTASPANMVSITTPVTTTDTTGRTTQNFQVLGNASGNITVTATLVSNANLKAAFNITVIQPITITGFTQVSGNNQSAPVGTAFSQPLVVQVTASSGSAANVPVQFQSNGSVSLSATNVSTDANGRAQVTATAGNISGAVTVVASIATNTGIGSQTFNLTVLPPPPVISAANFVNGADYQVQSLSPCSIGAVVAASGSLGVTNVSPTFPGQPLNNTDARLTINNVGAPILSIANIPTGQQAITFQVPCEATTGAAVPSVLTLAGSSINVNLNIQAASPGIFQTAGSDNVLRAVVFRPDGSPVTLTNPARRGENVSVLVTGLGLTSPPVGTSSVPALGGTVNAQNTIVVGMAGSGVAVVSSRLTEDLPGVFRVTFTIPSDMQTGSNVSISVASIPAGSNTPIYSATTKITVQ